MILIILWAVFMLFIQYEIRKMALLYFKDNSDVEITHNKPYDTPYDKSFEIPYDATVIAKHIINKAIDDKKDINYNTLSIILYAINNKMVQDSGGNYALFDFKDMVVSTNNDIYIHSVYDLVKIRYRDIEKPFKEKLEFSDDENITIKDKHYINKVYRGFINLSEKEMVEKANDIYSYDKYHDTMMKVMNYVKSTHYINKGNHRFRRFNVTLQDVIYYMKSRNVIETQDNLYIAKVNYKSALLLIQVLFLIRYNELLINKHFSNEDILSLLSSDIEDENLLKTKVSKSVIKDLDNIMYFISKTQSHDKAISKYVSMYDVLVTEKDDSYKYTPTIENINTVMQVATSPFNMYVNLIIENNSDRHMFNMLLKEFTKDVEDLSSNIFIDSEYLETLYKKYNNKDVKAYISIDTYINILDVLHFDKSNTLENLIVDNVSIMVENEVIDVDFANMNKTKVDVKIEDILQVTIKGVSM